METFSIKTERLDDLPLLYSQLEKMGIRELIDRYFPAHGNWRGISPGLVTTYWLMHIVSQSDHRLKYAEDWASAHRETLHMLNGQRVEPVELSDDRLARLLEWFSDDAPWFSFQADLNRGLLVSYSLPCETVRHDSTTVSSYASPDDDRLIQLGHSKDHRPDLGQIKVMLSTLDPLALPVSVAVVDGSRADDPLYTPAIQRVNAIFGAGLLHVGDSKMACRSTRAQIVSGGDDYLCPLPAIQRDALDVYLTPVSTGAVRLLPITSTSADGSTHLIAEGYTRDVTMRVATDETDLTWTERQFVVRSVAYATSQEHALKLRVKKASAALDTLLIPTQGKKRPESLTDCHTAIDRILKEHAVAQLLTVTCQEHLVHKAIRPYKDRPARTVTRSAFTLTHQVDEAALNKAVDALGWRIYATSATEQRLSLQQAVTEYRGEYRIEYDFSRLKGRSLSLKPMYLQRDDHRVGLVRLLTLALYLLALVQYQVRRELETPHDELTGLYGNITTNRPTTERLLQSFGNIHLTMITTPQETIPHITPLTPVQTKILTLLKINPNVYQFQKPT